MPIKKMKPAAPEMKTELPIEDLASVYSTVDGDKDFVYVYPEIYVAPAGTIFYSLLPWYFLGFIPLLFLNTVAK